MAQSPFCSSLPTQLRAWDSTSLRCFTECPRKYELSIVGGWRSNGSNIHLSFGSFYHECVEHFDRLRATGTDKPTATAATIEFLLALTWDFDRAAPWSGTYVPGWRCNNWEPGEKRSKFHCEAAKSWWDGHREDSRCPKCHASVTNRYIWAPEDKNKNRYTLLGAVLQYCDEQKETGGVQPIVFPDGQVALELSFRLELPYSCPDNVPYLLCGHLDSMVTVAGEACVRERKTTRSNVSIGYFDRYAPDTQIDNYDLAGNLLFGPTLHPTAVMVEVMQISATDTHKLSRGMVTITEGRREETLNDLGYWIKQAEDCARAGYYPKNTASCNANLGCQFRKVCREEPGDTRDRILRAYYHQDPWSAHILADRT